MLKTVLITGASRGIGAATAKVFASHNYNVIINYCHSKELSEELCSKLTEEFHIKAFAIKADISNQLEIENMLDQIKEKNIQGLII